MLNPLIGVGLRHPHYQQVLDTYPSIGWFEVHSENFFAKGGTTLELLSSVREHYPISLHGIGLSFGSAEGIYSDHLIRLKSLVDRINPLMISEHLSWSRIDGIYMPDLLPVPYNSESFQIFSQNISKTQDFLKREILIENPSSYIEYKDSTQEEVCFLVDLCKKTGAKILLDVNNVFVSCFNHGWNAKKYIDTIPIDIVREIHLAGHSIKRIDENQLLRIDTHDTTVCQEVWDLYEYTIQKFGAIYTLLEWDAQIPDLNTLIKEASKAQSYFPVEEKSYVSA